MIDETLFDAEEKMEKAVSVARDDLSSIRTGRANPGMFSRVVDRLLRRRPRRSPSCPASTCRRPRLVVIKPYEQSQLSAIEDAIRNSDLGVNPSNDGNVIRVAIPQLTEERRRELVKQAKSKGEDARVSVRNIRRKAMEELHRIKKDGEAGEDEVKHAEKDLDKTTAPVRRPDRRAGQAQRRRAAGGLDGRPATRVPWQKPPVDRAAEEIARRPQSARCHRRRRRCWARWRSGFCCSRRIGWLPVLAVAIPIATHEVVRRLREAGYAIPRDPAADRRPGDDLAVVAVTARPARWAPTAARSWCAWCGGWSGRAFASSRSTTCATSRPRCCSRRGCRCSPASARC